MPNSNTPTGFIDFERNGVRGFVRAEVRDALVEAIYAGPNEDDPTEQRLGGRGGLRQVETPLGRAFVRAYRRGGFIRHFVKSTYLRNRPLDEFRVHLEAQRRGVAVPEVLGVAYWRCGIGYRGYFATLAIPGRHLLDVLREGEEESRPVLRAASEAVRQMHDSGIFHADLQLMNLQWDGERAHILDLDNARAMDSVPPSRRTANLRRLERSFRKHGFEEQFRDFEAAYRGTSE
jgi:3-deoxy-D-manno-octulosonic acid kinase